MAVPSKATKNLMVASAGYGKAYYSLIAEKGRDYHEFITMCRGAQLAAEGAKAAAAPLMSKGEAGRSALRKVVTARLLVSLVGHNNLCWPMRD
jgi:hypothetical protein